ncbi:hypothetical protein ACD578_07870 [Microvirga sp. RSM25]|uniref:hypothetical protein n=1 Tax=Microvirga sp. RSM25 TaxID=3273802 RepID=UPI003850F4FF
MSELMNPIGVIQNVQTRLAIKLSELLEEISEDERLEIMEQIVQLFQNADLIPGEEAVRVNPMRSLEFSMDVIEVNEDLYQILNLNPGRIERAMRADDAIAFAESLT